MERSGSSSGTLELRHKEVRSSISILEKRIERFRSNISTLEIKAWRDPGPVLVPYN